MVNPVYWFYLMLCLSDLSESWKNSQGQKKIKESVWAIESQTQEMNLF